MSHPYDLLGVPGCSGRLIFTPCPGSKETSVAEALGTLQAAGAEALITLMPAGELEQNQAAELPALCAARSLEFSRSLNPELLSFERWLAANASRIPLPEPTASHG